MCSPKKAYFTSQVKEELSYGLRRRFEDKTIYIPPDPDIRDDLHSVRKITTAAGNIRFDTTSASRTDGHADRYWSLALAAHAAGTDVAVPLKVTSRGRREVDSMLRGYWDTDLSGYLD